MTAPHQAELQRQLSLLNMCIQLHFSSSQPTNRITVNRINSMRFHCVE
jgi:hypothetical protein